MNLNLTLSLAREQKEKGRKQAIQGAVRTIK